MPAANRICRSPGPSSLHWCANPKWRAEGRCDHRPRSPPVADLGNVAYEVLLQLLYRLLCQVDETDEQLQALSKVSIGLMFDVIEPLSEILTTLPVGPQYPGQTAGPTFELFYQPDYLLPHRRAAWLLMAEHLSRRRGPSTEAHGAERDAAAAWRPKHARHASTAREPGSLVSKSASSRRSATACSPSRSPCSS